MIEIQFRRLEIHYVDRPLVAHNDEHSRFDPQNVFVVIYLYDSFKWPPFFVGQKTKLTLS